jgi:hypothetical protein
MTAYRRNYNRLPVNAIASITAAEGLARGKTPVIIKDLSGKGAGIIAYSRLRVMQKVVLDLEIPPLVSHPVRKDCTVAWCRQEADRWLCGLTFGMDPLPL